MLTVNFHPFPVLTTQRLVLRNLLLSDATELYYLRSNEKVMAYLDKLPIASLESTIEKIQSMLQATQNNEAITWAITLKEETKLIGTISFWRLIKEHYRAEIGYNLLPQYWGKGIMHEAMQAAIQYSFNTMNLHSIEANVNPDNAASIKLLERNGFVKEAFFKENYYFKGQFLNSVVYSLLVSNSLNL